jgi:DinB superfamily
MADHQHSDKHETHRKLVARLREMTGDVRRITAGLDEASFAKRTVPDKWSLKELVCHLERMQEVFEGRVEAMLSRDNPEVARYDPENDKEFDKMLATPASATLAAFRAHRERLADRLEKLSPGDWHCGGRHPEFPHYDVHFQVEYMAHHEAHHIYQMFQRRLPLGKIPH